MAKIVPKEIIDWYENRLVKIRREYPDHLPKGFTAEEDILPALKIIKTTYFVIVILDHMQIAKKYPELVRDEGNIVIEFFRRRDFAHINSVCLYHVGSKGSPPTVSLEGNPIFNDETLDEDNFQIKEVKETVKETITGEGRKEVGREERLLEEQIFPTVIVSLIITEMSFRKK